jgi:hypothetical protein
MWLATLLIASHNLHANMPGTCDRGRSGPTWNRTGPGPVLPLEFVYWGCDGFFVISGQRCRVWICMAYPVEVGALRVAIGVRSSGVEEGF